MKKCICCKLDKSLDEFHKNRKSKDGLHSYCKECNSTKAMEVAKINKDKINFKRREKRRTDPTYGQKISVMKKKAYWKNREAHFLLQARQALKLRGISCTLELEDIKIPEFCPIFKVPFDRGRFAPSLDRIDNTKGYTKENIWIISRLANTMKNDGTISEIITFCTNLLPLIKQHKS